MRRALQVLALILVSGVVFGAGTSANVKWIAPTAYTDGSAVAAGDLDHYTLSWAPATGQAGPTGSVTIAGNLTAATVPVACGEVTFTISVTTSASARYPNVTSGPGGAVPYVTGVTCTVNPPTGLAVQ